MSGGNISNGQNGASGKGIEPTEIGGYRDRKKALDQNQKTIKYLEKQVRRQMDENNLLSDKVRSLAKEGQTKIDAIRGMFEKQTEELISARLTADKYITKCDELKERLEALEADN